jgi:CRP/FNR family transcriptional regulator, cyclic AMP receptor protein
VSAEKRDVIRRVRAFGGLGDDECDAVLGVLRAQRGNPGDTLFREGDPGDALMIVLEGQLVAKVRTQTGSEEEVARLGPGEVVGEMAFIDAEPRSATVSTAGGATVLTFTRAALASLKKSAPRVAAAIQRNVLFDVARRLRDAGEKLSEGAAGTTPKSLRGDLSAQRSARSLSPEQLRSIPALAAYGPEDIDLLSYIATLRTFPAGSAIMRESTEGDACFLIVGGTVAVSRTSSASALAQLGPGALVGQLALLDRAPRSATVTAQTETIALEVKASAFANLVSAHSPIALRFQEQVALAGVRQLREATRKVADAVARQSLPSSSGATRMLDDWDDGSPSSSSPALELELAVDPRRR